MDSTLSNAIVEDTLDIQHRRVIAHSELSSTKRDTPEHRRALQICMALFNKLANNYEIMNDVEYDQFWKSVPK